MRVEGLGFRFLGSKGLGFQGLRFRASGFRLHLRPKLLGAEERNGGVNTGGYYVSYAPNSFKGVYIGDYSRVWGLNSLKGVIIYVADSTGSIIGLIKGDTRSLDYGSLNSGRSRLVPSKNNALRGARLRGRASGKPRLRHFIR